MDELKEKIDKQLALLEELIKQEKEEEIEKQREILDELLNQYLKDL